MSQSEARKRLIEHGRNIIEEVHNETALKKFINQFRSVFIYVLIIAAVITFFMGHRTDTIIIITVLLINALIGFLQEQKAENAINEIRALLSEYALVRRSGDIIKISAEEVVVGDVVILEAGERVPADIELLEVRDLFIQEAILTGESYPVEKNIAENNQAFAGTHITRGRGEGVVTATAHNTEIGKIGGVISTIDAGKTPLQNSIDKFANWFCYVVFAVCVVVFAIGVLVHHADVREMVMSIIGIAVAVIPEGLPAVMSITLSIGMRRMARRNAIIRSLPSVETLGSVDIICTDKTGTLTHNELAVVRAVTAEHVIDVAGAGYSPKGDVCLLGVPISVSEHYGLHILTHASLLNNDAQLKELEQGWEMLGDPTEGALLSFAAKAGHDIEGQKSKYPRISSIPFDATRKLMATLHQVDGAKKIYIKGAPEVILKLCNKQMNRSGETEDLKKDYWQQQITKLAECGERVLAVAYIDVADEVESLQDSHIESGGVMIGMLGIMDKPREEAKQAIEKCVSAGIRVKMITGDHPQTAIAVARMLAIPSAEKIITGQQLMELPETELKKVVEEAAVFARTTPDQKLKIVQILRDNGHIVAMTGDGVNDALSLKQADIGVAMGKKGSALAKESSKMVIADDNFASIVAAVEEGRTVYENIKKSIKFILTTDIAEAMTLIVAVILGLTLPLTPAQILWVNTITAVTLSLSLSFDPKSADVMDKKPRSKSQKLYSRQEKTLALITGVGMTLVTLFVFYYSSSIRGDSVEYSRTMATQMLVMSEVAYLYSMRADWGRMIRSLLENKIVTISVIATILLQMMFIHNGYMNDIFSTVEITMYDHLLILGLALLIFLISFFSSFIFRKSHACVGSTNN